MLLSGRFDANSPGSVYVRETASSVEVEHQLFKAAMTPTQLPSTPPVPLTPPGLDAARQTYLYKYIREYVDDQWKDSVCPLPGSVFPVTTANCQSSISEGPQSYGSSDAEVSTPVKGGRGRGSRGRGRGGGRGRGRAKLSDDGVSADQGRGSHGRGRGSRGRGRGGGRGRGRDDGVSTDQGRG